MATKFVLLAALFAASVAFAAATTYTTVVTTTVSSDKEEQESWQSCQQEIQQVDPNRCQQFFSQGQGMFLRSAVGQAQQEQSLQECCNTIRQAKRECRCHAIQYALQQQLQGGQQEQEQELRQRAEQLPQLCRFKSPSQCSFNAVRA